ncbi:secreted RxLR effector protein 161-like [Silene latifolia]|uniref:secreted RxLR effector protein 161-like n=1 Tax=Silene latifolia TaxID=37657 RepID=UPI003D77CBE2
MVVRSLDIDKDPFRPRENNEEILGPEVPYLSAIGALMYIASTKDMGLFFPNMSRENLVGFADAGYLSDPHNARSQTGYVFTCGGTAISWRSMKQTITATSSNHSQILAIHEASRECVWLRSVIQHIREDCGLSFQKEAPTVLYEDNATCIAQLKEGY